MLRPPFNAVGNSPIILAMSKCLVVLVAVGACKFSYPADVPDDADGADDAQAACTPSTTSCAAGTLTVCDADGHPSAQTACSFGCAPGGDARCADLAPSNGLGTYLDQARTASPLVWGGDATIDTGTGVVTVDGTQVNVQTAVVSSAPVDILVIIARSVDIGNVTARGRRALAIVSDGDVTLRGTLSVSASHGIPGAGAGTTSDPACTAGFGAVNLMGHGGAGGGGFGSPGGSGGDGSTAQGGPGGEATGTTTLVPLRGGCPGSISGGVGGGTPELGHEGAAGGALQVSTRGSIVLQQGSGINASGGGGKGNTSEPFCPFCADQAGQLPACHQGAGGGAGGGILLEGAHLVASPSAALVANGGAGSCGYCGQAPDGTTTESPAPGQECSAASGIGSGGNGGAGTSGGFRGSVGSTYGGGGGGGTGRIRLNLPAGTVFDHGPPTVSPTPSTGPVATR